MGQVLAVIQSKFRGHQWRQAQLRKISDKVFDSFTDDPERDYLVFEDLYMAILFVYNDMNKHFPGPHIDPPSKSRVKSLVEVYDVNLDGRLNRDEFAGFIQVLTAEALKIITKTVIASLIVAPTVALMTKRTTERVPGVGKVIQGIPNSMYASMITFIVLMIQNSGKEFE